MELAEFVYSPQAATATTPEYERISNDGAHFRETDNKGNDLGNFSTTQVLCVTWSEPAGRWFIISDHWKELLSDGSIKKAAAAASW